MHVATNYYAGGTSFSIAYAAMHVSRACAHLPGDFSIAYAAMHRA